MLPISNELGKVGDPSSKRRSAMILDRQKEGINNPKVVHRLHGCEKLNLAHGDPAKHRPTVIDMRAENNVVETPIGGRDLFDLTLNKLKQQYKLAYTSLSADKIESITESDLSKSQVMLPSRVPYKNSGLWSTRSVGLEQMIRPILKKTFNFPEYDTINRLEEGQSFGSVDSLVIYAGQEEQEIRFGLTRVYSNWSFTLEEFTHAKVSTIVFPLFFTIFSYEVICFPFAYTPFVGMVRQNRDRGFGA